MADGRGQCEYTPKDEGASPTVSLEALLLTCVIDVQEEHDVATADISGALISMNL